MVASYQDDLDLSDDENDSPAIVSKSATHKVASADVILSSDEEEQEKKSDTESESDEPDSVINRLANQFGDSVNTQGEHSQGSDSSEGGNVPHTIKYDADLSDDNTLSRTATGRMPQVRNSRAALNSSKDILLTDSEDDRPHVLADEQVSSEDESLVSLANQRGGMEP